jgi:hypothetical protein
VAGGGGDPIDAYRSAIAVVLAVAGLVPARGEAALAEA